MSQRIVVTGATGFVGQHTVQALLQQPDVPTSRAVYSLVAQASDSPKPMYSVPYAADDAFAALMEALHPMLGGKAPFLTRSIVHVWPSLNQALT